MGSFAALGGPLFPGRIRYESLSAAVNSKNLLFLAKTRDRDWGRFSAFFSWLRRALNYFSEGHAAPRAAQRSTALRKRVSDPDTGFRPSPGCQAQRTSGVCICSTICVIERCPFCRGPWSSSQIWWLLLPAQVI